jgi:nicotinate-nucleotide--dimethylbenzimidazole phosphoribosyltransferase
MTERGSRGAATSRSVPAMRSSRDAERLQRAIEAIGPLDLDARAAAEVELGMKTKPRGSLGRLETLAAQVAAVRGSARPGRLRAAIVVAAADHGVAAEGVSAYPREVTAQMVANFDSGGAAVAVLARRAGARLVVVDAGVAGEYEAVEVRRLGLGAGSANSARGPAMSEERALTALVAGIELAEELVASGIGAVALGEMGIGNTTAASALTAALLGAAPEDATGPGTGLDADGVAHKAAVVRQILAVNRPPAKKPLVTLSRVGGLEIALLAGLAIGAAAGRAAVVVDGFISAAAALVAARLAPALSGYLLAAHLSPEPGHALILSELGLDPLLDLGLRLGEGSGAAVALPLIDAALAILDEMATFGDAGVTDAGR